MEGSTSIIEESETLRENNEDVEAVQGSGCRYLFFDPRGKCHRLIALVFMCFLGFGSYFCYDSPGALQDKLMKDLNLSAPEYLLFYSLYSWPNTVLCFVGGFLVDRVFGIRLGAIVYMVITLAGQLFFASGAYFDLFWMMAMGRFIFGLGGESLAVAQNNYAVLWFKGKELNMVFGLQLSFSRFGSSVCFWTLPPLYNAVSSFLSGYQCMGLTLYIATLTCVLSLICGLILGGLDQRAERITQRPQVASEDKIQLRDIKDFRATFWLLTLICATYYVTIFPFIAIAQKFIMERFDMDDSEANQVTSLVYFISVFASPILGLVIDLLGRNILCIAIAIVVTMLAHCLIAFVTVTPYLGVVLLGLSYSLLACGLWPLVSLVVPEKQLGTAYGICQSIQNLALAVFSQINGYLIDDLGYDFVEYVFIGCLICALSATVAIYLLDKSQNGTLNLSAKERKAHAEAIAANEEDRERLLGDSSSSDLLQPNSDLQIRNRYLSRIGAPLSGHIDDLRPIN